MATEHIYIVIIVIISIHRSLGPIRFRVETKAETILIFWAQTGEECERGHCKLAEKRRQAKHILSLLELCPVIEWAVWCFHGSRPRIWSQNTILKTDEGRLAHNNVSSVCFANTLERRVRRSCSC